MADFSMSYKNNLGKKKAFPKEGFDLDLAPFLSGARSRN